MNDLSLDLSAQHTQALSPEQRACLLGHDPARADAGSHRLRLGLSAAQGPADIRAALQRYGASQPILGTRWLQVTGLRGWRQAVPNQGGAVRWVELDAMAPALNLASDEVLAVSQRALANGVVELEFVAAALALDPPSLERLAADVLALARGEAPTVSEVGYEHYVQWRQDMAADADAAQGRAYWQHEQIDPARATPCAWGCLATLRRRRALPCSLKCRCHAWTAPGPWGTSRPAAGLRAARPVVGAVGAPERSAQFCGWLVARLPQRLRAL